ncbi:MAG: DUF502 domain-containing protein [Chitinispirillales bacterium]|jgi:uncharacterized membrane protein|nr:DUF502 domain-containing protein [Chitinispirillales bacterium]
MDIKNTISRAAKQLRNNIIAGVFVILPVFITVFLIVKIFLWVDSSLPGILGMEWGTGLGILVLLAIAFFAGLIAKNYFGKKIIATGNAVINKIPIVNKVYPAVQQIIDAINMQNKKLFNRVVLVEFPKENSYSIAFVTAEENPVFSNKTGKKLIAVYMITAPNPTSGFLVYYPEEDVIDIDMPVDVAMKKIMSFGMLNDDPLIKAAFPGSQADITLDKASAFKQEAEVGKKLDPKI